MIRTVSFTADHAGGIAAGLCGVHCAVMPIIPCLAGFAMQSEWVGTGCLVLSVMAGAVALRRGWNCHRNPAPALLWGLGCGVSVLFHLAEGSAHSNSLEPGLTIGAVAQVVSHWLNHRFSCRISG
jgi:hypothetical protein